MLRYFIFIEYGLLPDLRVGVLISASQTINTTLQNFTIFSLLKRLTKSKTAESLSLLHQQEHLTNVTRVPEKHYPKKRISSVQFVCRAVRMVLLRIMQARKLPRILSFCKRMKTNYLNWKKNLGCLLVKLLTVCR